MAAMNSYRICLSIFISLFVQHIRAQCPDAYSSMAGMCIKMGQRVPWEKAQGDCTKDNSTLILTKVKDQWDQAAGNIPVGQLTGVWFGLHFDKANTKWSWSDGAPFDPDKDWAPWATGQPNTKAGECVVIKVDTKQEGKPLWAMGPCTTAMTGVCVKPQQTTIGTGTPFTFPVFPNITCPTGMNAFAGNCMKYNQDPATYEDATATCVANNSYILFTKDPVIWEYAAYGLGPQLPNFWIGLAYDQKKKAFMYSNGDTYSDKDWAPWAPENPGSPDAWAGDCVGVIQDYASGKFQWYMVDCSSGLQGVCLYNMPTEATSPATTTTTTLPATTTTTTEPPTTAPATTTTTTMAPTTTTTAALGTTTTMAAAVVAITSSSSAAASSSSAAADSSTLSTAGAATSPPSISASSSTGAQSSTSSGGGTTGGTAGGTTGGTTGGTAGGTTGGGTSGSTSAGTTGSTSGSTSGGKTGSTTGGTIGSTSNSAVAGTTSNVSSNSSTSSSPSSRTTPSLATILAGSNATLGMQTGSTPTSSSSPGSSSSPTGSQATNGSSSGTVSTPSSTSASSSVSVAGTTVTSNATAGTSSGSASSSSASPGSTQSVITTTGIGSTSTAGTTSTSTMTTGTGSTSTTTTGTGSTSTSGSTSSAGTTSTSTAGTGSTTTANSTSTTISPTSTAGPSCYRVGRFLPAPAAGRLTMQPIESPIGSIGDAIECGKQCLQRTACASIDYNRKTMECRLMATAFAQDCTQFVRDSDYQHFDLISSDLV